MEKQVFFDLFRRSYNGVFVLILSIDSDIWFNIITKARNSALN